MKEDISKVFQQTLILLSGEEYLLRARALKELVEMGAGGDDFDLEVFVADSSAPSQWIASAGTSPFLSPRRTVVVRNVCRSDAYKEFKSCDLPETGLLILVGDDEPGDYDKQKKVTTIRKGWEKAVSAVGGEVVLFAVDPKDVRQAIRAEAEAKGKKMSDAAAELLKEMTGANLSRALDEVEKLCLYAGKDIQIREQEVRDVALPSPEWNVFKLIDAITHGDNGAALRQLKLLVGNATKVEDVAFSSIFPQLSSQLKLIWQARICLDARVQPGNAPPEILDSFPERPNLARESDWRQSRATQAARALDFVALSKCFQAMSDADSGLKGLLPSFSAIDSLERMVLEMMQAVKPAKATVR